MIDKMRLDSITHPPRLALALTIGAVVSATACSPEVPEISGTNEAIICDGIWDVSRPQADVLPYDAATQDGGIIDKMGASESSLQGAIVEALLQIGNNPDISHFPNNCSVTSQITDNQINDMYDTNLEKGNVAVTVPIISGDRKLLLIAPPVTAVGLNE